MKPLGLADKAAGTAQAVWARPGIRRYERLPSPAAEQRLLRRLRRVVDHAYRTVPFYRELYGEAGYQPGALRSIADLAALPIISKTDLLGQRRHRVVSSAVPIRRLLPSVTSGTTGEVLTVWHDSARLGRLGLAIIRISEMTTRHRPWDRMLYVYTSRFPVRSVFGLYPMEFVSTTASPEAIAAAWRLLRPAVVWIYPSRLRDLLAAGMRLPRTRLVSVGSEFSTALERARWEEELGSPVRDQYGAEELGLVAAECHDRRRHVLSDMCFVEVLGPEGRPASTGAVGDVVGTNLDNLAMPIIRYRQGDRAALTTSDCPCGRTLPVLHSLEGRARIDLRAHDGSRVSSGVVVDTLYGLVLELGLPLVGYQLVDGDPPELLLQGRLSDRELASAAAFFAAHTGLVVVPRAVDQLPYGPGGKREAVVASPSKAVGTEIEDIHDHPSQEVKGDDPAGPPPHPASGS